MAWFHQYRFAEITDPASSNMLTRGKAFPILRFKIRTDPGAGEKIKKVQLLLQEHPLVTAWYSWDKVRLYRGRAEFATLPEQKRSRFRLSRLMKYLKPLGIDV